MCHKVAGERSKGWLQGVGYSHDPMSYGVCSGDCGWLNLGRRGGFRHWHLPFWRCLQFWYHGAGQSGGQEMLLCSRHLHGVARCLLAMAFVAISCLEVYRGRQDHEGQCMVNRHDEREVAIVCTRSHHAGSGSGQQVHREQKQQMQRGRALP